MEVDLELGIIYKTEPINSVVPFSFINRVVPFSFINSVQFHKQYL